MPEITIDVPDERYEGLIEAAAQENTTPAEWIIARLPLPRRKFPGAKTMYDRFAGRLGVVSSGQPASDDIKDAFGEYLEEKHRNGHL